MRASRAGIGAFAALTALAACSTGGPRDLTPPAVSPPPPPVYVAVGASESAGYGADKPVIEAWPQVVYRGLDPTTVFVNLGVPGSTTAEALIDQVPEALRLEPTLVTVWLNVNDMNRAVSVDEYERALQALVHALRRGGRAAVLVANTPPVERLPALRSQDRYYYNDDVGQYYDYVNGVYLDALPTEADIAALVDSYNEAIQRVVSSEGAVLVDLHTAMAAVAEEDADALVSNDGFHPSTAGHELIAATFAAALPT